MSLFLKLILLCIILTIIIGISMLINMTLIIKQKNKSLIDSNKLYKLFNVLNILISIEIILGLIVLSSITLFAIIYAITYL